MEDRFRLEANLHSLHKKEHTVLKTRKFRDADDSTTFARFVLAVLVRLFGRSRDQRRLKILVEHIDFSIWVQANFLGATLCQTREKLWKQMQKIATEVDGGVGLL